MATKVTITKLKSIKRLEFDVPTKGAFIVTGANGCGKTSLLTCLHRIGNRFAFQTGLPGGRQMSGIDGLADATIHYLIDGKEVSYRYNQIRWSATPKVNSQLVAKAFKEVLFLKADSSRVEPTQEDLKGAKKLAADEALRAFMNSVFDTTKFNLLFKINLRGRGTAAHLIDKTLPGDKRKSWYSEKAFSLGELCVMRLGQKLLKMKQQGLYIVDEFEMALHPAAQVRLFNEIEKLANSVNCTVLVSTHSASLIKSVRRKNIIYLENNDGEVAVHRDVYPTFALQHLALDEETSPDKLIFVEDVAAKQCVEELLRLHFTRVGQDKSIPSVMIAVIGGYLEVLRFLERSGAFVPPMTRRLAALDADSAEVCDPPTVLPGQPMQPLTVPQELFHRLSPDASYLPWTPEVGFCDLLAGDLTTHRLGIQHFTSTNNLQIPVDTANAHLALSGGNRRKKCKQTVDLIADQIVVKRAWSKDRAQEALMSYFVSEWSKANAAAAKALSGRLFA